MSRKRKYKLLKKWRYRLHLINQMPIVDHICDALIKFGMVERCHYGYGPRWFLVVLKDGSKSEYEGDNHVVLAKMAAFFIYIYETQKIIHS